MKRLITITPQQIHRVKELLKTNGIRETARKVKISYYTAWCISQGKYDDDKPLQQAGKYVGNACPITGLVFF